MDNIDAHTSFEQRIIMPKTYFKSTKNARVINKDAKALIEADQKKYQDERNKQNFMLTLFETIGVILCIIPLGIYAFFGREPKIDYDSEYEYDLPSDETPVQVNAIMTGELGDVNNNAFSATILDLIDRKYFKVVTNDDTNTIIRQTEKDVSNLKKYELSLIDFLSTYADNGDISIGFVGSTAHRANFKNFIWWWYNLAKKDVPDSLINKYFDNKGLRIRKYFIVILVLMFIIYWILIFTNNFSTNGMIIICIFSVIFLVLAFLLYLLPKTVLGRWTPEGKEVHEKWKNFEKYLKDYSLIEERPPASVQVWGKYLVYATALGCASEVTKNMKKYYNSLENKDDYFEDSDVASFTYYGGLSHIEASLATLSYTEHDSDGSDIGSSGSGGFGGGGGGTF